MRRKPKQSCAQPGPGVEAAFDRIVRTAHVCAASLTGDKPARDPNDASHPALIMAMAMVYFLCRIDPKDMAALVNGEGGTAGWKYRPMPKGDRRAIHLLADMLP